MIRGFIAQKKSMSNIYDDKGKRVAVTALLAKPVKVSLLRNKLRDGYDAVQVTYGIKGHMEFEAANPEALPEINQEITPELVFAVNDNISVTAKTKGRGFAGVIKRHGFRRQPVSGGQSDRVRAPGSIGAQTPGKVIKGKKMPGHYGNKNMTVTNLKIVSFDTDKNLVYVSGSVPGHLNSWVTITK
jgi:large subunit ribosomal protein L3